MAKHRQSTPRSPLRLERFTALAISDGKRGEHGERSQPWRERSPPKTAPKFARLVDQHPARVRVAAVPRSVDQRPQAARRLDAIVGLPEHPRAEAEQQIASEPDRLARLRRPR